MFEYLTPVMGTPWSAPFEFPLYQLIVARISSLAAWPLDFTGRLTTLILCYLTCIPMTLCLRRYGMAAVIISIACFLTGPIGLFFSRTFLIESLATLLSFSALCAYVGYRRHRDLRYILLFVVLGSLAGLQKITTFAPVVMVCLSDALFTRRRLLLDRADGLKSLGLLSLIASSLLVPLIWAEYTDGVKKLGYISSFLTSTELEKWNFGTIGLRFQFKYWINVFFLRLTVLGGLSVALLLILIARLRHCSVVNGEMLMFLAAGLLGPLIFANLHFLHDYYQLGSLAFLSSAMAIALSDYGERTILASRVRFAMLVWVVIATNAALFEIHYFSKVLTLPARDVNAVQIATYLKDRLPADDVILIVGSDWNSTIPYYAQRFALMIPDSILAAEWPAARRQLLRNPKSAIGGREFGSIIYCDNPADSSAYSAGDIADLLALVDGETKTFDECTVKIRRLPS